MTLQLRHVHAAAFGVAYVGTIVAASWAISTFDPIAVWWWPQVHAPAGVLFAGLAFTLRDRLHDLVGKAWTLAAIVAGTAVSLLVSGWAVLPGGVVPLAFAAAAAFLVSELADMASYSPLRERGRWLTAVAVSNTVGLVVDSVLFLWLAFGSLAFLPGQLVGKVWMTLLAVGALAVLRRRRVVTT